MPEHRRIELEVAVTGTPEEVWKAIATGAGISSWYVPHEVEEREGGTAVARFGPGPEMEIPGRVAAWDPPNRIVFDGGEPGEGFAFEWLIEARGNGTCIVRLVNSGFGAGDDWDAQYDAMTEGWKLFLCNLKLHLGHFAGQHATASLPTATAAATQAQVWDSLTHALRIDADPAVGQRVDVTVDDAPPLAGTVVDAAPYRIALLLDTPTNGTAFIAAEGVGDQTSVSIWSYLYGADGAELAARDGPLWDAWLANHI